MERLVSESNYTKSLLSKILSEENDLTGFIAIIITI